MTTFRSQVASTVFTIIMTAMVIAAPMASLAQDTGKYAVCPMTMKTCATSSNTHSATTTPAAPCCEKHAKSSPSDGDSDSKPCHQGRCSCCITLYAGGIVLVPVTPSSYTLIEPASHKLAIDSLSPLLPGWCEPLRRPPRA